jgi:hypothetical protein
MGIIPFYGTEHPELFALERAAMDPEGLVVEALDAVLPAAGTILDVGAGDGFAAQRLNSGMRTVVAMEPARAMIDQRKHLRWVNGDAEAPVRGRFLRWCVCDLGVLLLPGLGSVTRPR